MPKHWRPDARVRPRTGRSTWMQWVTVTQCGNSDGPSGAALYNIRTRLGGVAGQDYLGNLGLMKRPVVDRE